MTTTATDASRPPAFLNGSLWIVQALLALLFAGTGVWKLVTPTEALGAVFPWMGELPTMARVTGVFDLLGGLGILLPSLTRIRPRLAVFAAAGCVALQLSAIVFHFSRGEGGSTPFNFFLVALSALVVWGRGWRAPIESAARPGPPSLT